ncbi:PDZ and LIM domain protein Zasp isoform X14 [Lucilia sericata]|uniref:PDZ and LIM domain protein Zasp isoform X14 n=1 Tax=Lucilia sericata TaxID=13632 RepID=UPI0018A83566|nr:PDZ and LIM domain protein Zasp isoform X14 [Lucilia sericata]
MAQPQLLQIKLSRFDAQPWGFRLQGGTDFAAPLLVQKVNGGSLAEQAGLMPGDAVIKINDVDVFNLRHKDAQDIVVRSGNNFVITVQRGGSTWRPHVQPTGQMPQPNSPYLQTVTKTSLAHKQQESQHIGCGYNNAAKPFGNGVDGNVKSIVNKQYNSPVGIYSDESIAETLSAQAEVLAGGVLGVNFKKNEKEYQADKSEVLKFLREEESGPSTPEPHSTSNYYWTRSHAIGGHHKQDSDDERIGTPLQQNTLAPAATHRPSLPTPKSTANTEPPKPAVAAVPEIPDPRLIVMPVCPALQTPEYKEEMEAAAKAAALGPDGQPRPLSASGHPPCAMCGVGIVGVFVRIKDRNLHVECFKCATCGTSLKNQGYYNFNNKLYCDIHAKLAAMQNPPSGTEGYVPIPIKPNTKLSASTITSALNAHGYNNGVSNGSSTPAPVNQGGYARPYGAAPPAAAPKSPVSYPPQQQQWNQPPPTQPKPTGGNAYATLPRSNVGQQESLIKPSMLNDTLPRKTNAKPKTNASFANANASLQQTDLPNDDPTAMLNESIGKINMGHKMDNFMAEAGKVISNMLEARLANNGNGMPSPHSSSSLSLRSNSSSNLSRSPMVVRKRLDLDDFKDINPSQPAALKPVIAVHQNVELKPDYKAQPQVPKGVHTTDLPVNHPMGKVLELCDNKAKPQSPLAVPVKPEVIGSNLPPSETVIYRNNDRSNRRASHATDRRSYIETNTQNEQPKDGPVFSISVKALGKPGEDPNKPMSPENEEVVSQLLKDGKKPICCQCNVEITSGPFITALGKIWCPEHFHCVNGNCRRPLQDIGFVEEKGDLYCEYCFEKYLAPTCSKCAGKIKGDCLNAIGKHFHPECFACGHCGKLFGNTPFFLEDGMPYCEADWNELFTTKCFACGFPVEAGDRWVEALNHNYHSQCFNCTYCKQNLEGQSFYNKGGRPFCKNHAR